MKHHDIRHADARFQYRCPALPITSTSRGIDRKPMHHTSLCFLSILKIYPHHSYFSHLFTFFTTDPSLSLGLSPCPSPPNGVRFCRRPPDSPTTPSTCRCPTTTSPAPSWATSPRSAPDTARKPASKKGDGQGTAEALRCNRFLVTSAPV